MVVSSIAFFVTTYILTTGNNLLQVVSCKEFKAKSSQVPDMFLKEFPIALHLYPICFGKCCTPFTHIGGPRGRKSILQNIYPSILGSLHSFFFFLSDGPIKLAHCNKKEKEKKIELGRQPHLMNRRGE
jgi:hypothetical protein